MTQGLGGQSQANVQPFLVGVLYPARKQDLIRRAKHNQAPEDVIDMIEAFPDEKYRDPQDVMKAYGAENYGP